MINAFVNSFQEKIWRDKYQYKNETFKKYCTRISSTVFSKNEKQKEKLFGYLKDFKILFGGRTNSNIGTDEKGVTLFNCFINPMVTNPDSLKGILKLAQDYAITLKTEGGVGFCANFLRPANTLIRKIGVTTPGAIKFLELFDKLSEIITSGNVNGDTSYQGTPTKKSIRKGATMVTLSICHPDIEEFITAKATPNRLTKMNMSVLITDAFIYAMKNNLDWDLWFPDITFDKYDTEWDGDFEKWGSKGYPFVIYKTVKAVYLWDLLLKNTFNRSEPGVLFIDNARRMDNLHYLEDCTMHSTNPCGEVFGNTGKTTFEGKEYLLGDVCNLGSVNVTKFYDVKTKEFRTNELLDAVDILIRSLDNIIDVSNYPLPMHEDAAKLKRKIGVGMLGVGSLMMMMNLRYGGDGCIKFLNELLSKVVNKAYQTSALMAKEFGSFALYDKKLLDGGYVKNSGVLSTETIEMIKKYGLRHSALMAIAPTGCIVGSTLIPTSKGCVPIENCNELSHNPTTKLSSDFGHTFLNNWFDQGNAKTVAITTKHGYSIEGTPEHKVRTITEGNGYGWKELCELKKNDVVVLKKDFIFDKKGWLMNSKIAELLGFYMADGWWDKSGSHNKRLYFQVHNNEVIYITTLLHDAFSSFNINIITIPRKDENSTRINVNSNKLYEWFEKHGCIKDGAVNAFIPDIILQGTKLNILSFIKGFFNGDGGFNKWKENMRFTTVSPNFATCLHTVLLGLGYPSHMYVEHTTGNIIRIKDREIRSNYDPYRIELNTYYSRELCKALNLNCKIINNKWEGKNFEHVVLSPYEYNKFNRADMIQSYDHIYCVTKHTYDKEVSVDDYNWFVKNNLYIDVIKTVEKKVELQQVYDLEIHDKSHTYVANGFITHNTLSIVAGNVSGGLEPVFANEFNRWNRVEGKNIDFEYPNVHKGEWFETDYFKEQKIGGEFILISKDRKYRIDKNSGLCEQTTIKDYGYNIAKENGFKETLGAMELSVKNHLNVLGVFASKIDQSSSKTINLPSDMSFEDFKKLYGEVHSLGVKGCTTYREGSSIGVLEVDKKEKNKTIRKQQKEFLDVFKEQSDEGVVVQSVKLPEQYPSNGYILRSEGKKWYIHVAFKDKACTRPFAMFVNTNNREDNVVAFNALERLEELAVKEGLNNGIIEVVKRKYAYQKNPVKICRMLGFLLRHNVRIYKIVKALDGVEEASVGTFVFRIKKFLAQFIKHISEPTVCPDCKEKSLIFTEGCYVCKQCGYSKCG